MTVDDTIIVGAFSAAFTALGSVVAIMWRRLSSEHQELAAKSNECEEDREKLWAKLAEVSSDVPRIESCPAKECPLQVAKRKTTRVFIRPPNAA